MNTKKKFFQEFDNIKLNNNFNQIKDNIYIKELDIETKKPNLSFLYPIFLALLIVALIIPISISISTNKKIDDFKNYEVSLKSYSEDVSLNDQDIYINYPMMVNSCNLEEELEFNSNWEIFSNGKKVDKQSLNLDLGSQQYELYLYKLNQVVTVYNLNIQVGD